MVARARPVPALAIAVIGSLTALLFGGDQILACLGPLGVTAVRCAAHTGARPTEGPMVGMLIAANALALVIATARARVDWSETAATLGGAVVGAIAYVARRPLTLEGPDYDGTWLVVPLPVSGSALVSWTFAGAVAGLAVLAVARAVRDRRRSG
jgi:hypothetical protein